MRVKKSVSTGEIHSKSQRLAMLNWQLLFACSDFVVRVSLPHVLVLVSMCFIKSLGHVHRL